MDLQLSQNLVKMERIDGWSDNKQLCWFIFIDGDKLELPPLDISTALHISTTLNRLFIGDISNG